MGQVTELNIDISKSETGNVLGLKLKQRFYKPEALQLYSDIISMIVGYFIYYFVKYETGLFYNAVTPDLSLIFMPLTVLLIFWLIVFWFSGMFKNWYLRSPFDEVFTVIRVTFIGSFFLFILVFFDSAHSPRMVFLAYFLILGVSVSIGRITARQIQKKLRMKGIYSIPSILVGSLKESYEFFDKIKKSPAWGYKPIGFVVVNREEESKYSKKSNSNYPDVLGSIDNIDKILEKYSPQEVLITVDSSNRSFLTNIANKCSERGILIKIVPDLYDVITGLVKTLPVYGIPLIEISTQLLKPWEETLKRFIDIVFSVLVIIIGFPFWFLFGILIKIESTGNVFYKQERIGKDNKPFMIYKFRSMRQNADKDGPKWTQVNDPRVTRIGYILRKTHLDEIPQFLNVLLGDMSIVGPRPEITSIVNKYAEIVPSYRRRLVVRPGITGWWQVNYTTYEESTEEIESRLKDDFYYIENMSLKLDLEIMVRTVLLMIKGHGQS